MNVRVDGVRRLGLTAVCAVCCIALLASLVVPVSASAAPSADGGVTVDQAAERLVELNTQLEMASEDLAQIDYEIDTTKQQIEKIKKERSETEEKLAAAKKTLALTVEEMYENGNVSYLEVLLGAATFDDFVSKLDLLERVSHSRASAIENVNALQSQLDQQESDLKNQLAQQQELKSQAESKMTTIKTSINASENLYESIPTEMREEVNERADSISRPSGESDTNAGSAEQSAEPSRPQGGSSASSGSASEPEKPAQPSKPAKPSKPSGSSSSGGSTSSAGAHPEVVSIAKKYLGVKYVWGGESPKTGFDCSGLTMYCYRQIGIDLSHSSRWQYEEGTHIAKSALQPGDLVFFGPSVSGIHHVGIYCGSGQYIHAPQTGDVVKISSLSSRSDYVGACRP